MRTPDWFNVRDYGAVGDGSHDDTEAIQTAVTAAGAVGPPGPGATVYLPPGNYKITGAINWPDPAESGYYAGVSLVGDSPKTTYISYAGPTEDTGDPFNRAFALKLMGQTSMQCGRFSLINNAGAIGTTIGVYMDSDNPGTGTVAGQCSFYDLGVNGFYCGMNLGSGQGRDVSEVLIVHPHLVSCTTGILGIGQNSITFIIQMLEAQNCGVAVRTITAQGCHVFGGSTAANGCDFAFDTSGGYSITGVRGEQTYMLSLKGGQCTVTGCDYTVDPANSGYIANVRGGGLTVSGSKLGGALVPQGQVDIQAINSIFVGDALTAPFTPTPQTWTHGADPIVWGDGAGFGNMNGVRVFVVGCALSTEAGSITRYDDAHGIYDSSNVLQALNSL